MRSRQLGAHALRRALGDGVRTDERVAAAAREQVVVRRAARAANADLVELAGLDEALVDDVADRRAVMELVAPHVGGAEVEVRVEVDERHRSVPLRERAKDGQGDRVIAADHDRGDLRGHQLADLRLDRGAHRSAIERREHDVAGVDAAQPLEHVDAVIRVIPLDERRHAAQVIRREARTGLIGRAAVVRDTEQRDIGVGDVRRRGEPEERGLAVTEVLKGGLLHRCASCGGG